MKVAGREMHAVWWSEEGILFIDQRRLPHVLEIGLAATVEDVVRAIQEMGVRGAPAIGVLAAYGLALAARSGAPVAQAYEGLLHTRPTAINLKVGLDAVMVVAPDPVRMLEAARTHDRAEIDAAESIGIHGLTLMRSGSRVLTHCNAGWLAVQDWGTALAPIYKAARAGMAPFVYVSETRPRLQGARITAWELSQEGIAHALVADSAHGSLMQRGKIDLVITGADRVAANGDVVNKIGTYPKACAARANGIPFYVAAPLTTFDRSAPNGAAIPIEERPGNEVLTAEGIDPAGAWVRVRLAPAETEALNPAFDVTPHALIDGLITEVGIVPASAEGVEEAFQRAAARV